ncbi:MAG: trypsin-like peptidase domain-containing protein [Cyclobacteriaceae bacterium]|nr:trypsin-like peptidase domain-containing protein [Cyclobacteriaceae bacterium]MDH4297822.1 trypsin-like peptidase domain-containing protein [Cyclobacteriaceae bacterium]MDH5249958.1 trypsin-like peptidase domain-containing protein [Cyclobacteriaceae bacterium]
MKNTLKIVIAGFVAGFAGAFTFYYYFVKPVLLAGPQTEAVFNPVSYNETPLASTPPTSSIPVGVAPVDFSEAASKATQSVVYINSISRGASYTTWDWFFGEATGGGRTQVSSGSGVIFTADGYIITNNHVIESAERIEVNYNKRNYPAELIGTNPATDLAVIKIKETGLPAIDIGSSKNLQVGEWVIAVGNPFSLASTVTAGIVSAKGRRIGILEDKFPIESFIQTDAAINPGNSGGALVNRSGELVGINSAILSRTGSYTGYAFAIPVDIVKKVFDDLVKYGIVQQGFIGGAVVEYNYENAKKYDLDTKTQNYVGVLLESMEKNGPAMEAGLKPGDIIIRINNEVINSQSAFEEELSYHYPGDKITITYVRGNATKTASLDLVNLNGTTEILTRKIVKNEVLGAQLEATQYGVKVFKIQENSVLKKIGVPENFTIIAINRARVKDPEEVIEFFAKYRGRGALYGINSSRQQVEIPFVVR